MRVIIAGGRDIHTPSVLLKAITDSNFDITEVVCGDAPGIDTMGSMWAAAHNIPVKHFPADWAKNGKAAGPIRNSEMAKYGEALILIWDGKSRGSYSMRNHAIIRKMPMHEVIHVK